MHVEADSEKILFRFSENEYYFEMGKQILKQENFEEMLPFKRMQVTGNEQLVYDVSGDSLEQLGSVLAELGEKRIIDIIYELFYLVVKIEESGFIKRQCLWYKYDSMYYDLRQETLKLVILPITGNFIYSEADVWFDDFEDAIERIAAYLRPEKSDKVLEYFTMVKRGELEWNQALQKIDMLGCSVSSILYARLEKEKNVKLRLIYSERNNRIDFLIDNEEFTIGRNSECAQGVIPADMSRAVSRKHCLITKMNNKFFVQDLESANHTLVNGIMIPPYEIMELEDEDILSVADMEFRVKKINS